MQLHITPNNKLASIGTIGLLFLAGIAGMVFLLPASPAHAAGATVTLSTISPLSTTVGGPTELTGVTSGTVGSSLTITGTGFASDAAISVSSTVGTTTIPWFTNQLSCGFATATGGNNGIDSLVSSSCVTTTAVGSFKTVFVVPAMPGGAQTIVVTDGTNTVSTSFTITPKVSFATTSTNNYGFPETSLAGSTLTVSGFGATEQVTFTSTAFTGGFVSGSTNCTTNAVGSCATASTSFTVADTTGGAKSVTATGGTSSLTASTTYTIKPWAAFYNSAGGATTFSFIGTAPTSLLIEVHGMTAQTVAAGSITVGGVATSHAAFTIGSSGAAAGIVVSPTGTVPFGNAAVVIGGTTFNYATGNIAVGTQQWGGTLISSIQGSGSSTGVVQIDQTTYKPGAPYTVSKTNPAPVQNQVGFFAYGFVVSSSCGGAGGQVTFGANGANWTSTTFQSGNCITGGSSPGFYVDANGAIFAKGLLTDTAWSARATPAVAASYTPTLTQPEAPAGPANTLNPSFGITPWIDTSSSHVISSVVDYTTTTSVGFTAHGFGATDAVTFTVGGTSVSPASAGTCNAVSGLVSLCGAGTAKMPDLAAGPQNMTATGSVSGAKVTTTGAITYDPAITGGGSSPTTLSSPSGNSGSTTIIRTGTSYGVHGLYANTAYSIVWNAGVAGPGTTGTVLGTFTSTATGGIPVPGVQITIPADTSGIHIIDLQRTSTIGTSFMFSNNLQATFTDNDFTPTVFQTNYGEMLFNEGTSLVATPTVANVGTSVTISGTGLQASTLYDLGVTQAGLGTGTTPSTCVVGTSPNAAAPLTISGTFTSTSTGAVPSAVSVLVTDQATFNNLEQGTLMCVEAYTGPDFGTASTAGFAQFILQASESINMTSAPSGHNVLLTAHALNANKGYNILFAPYACGNSGSICGTIVGAILSNNNGAGSGTFTVPNTIQTAAGSQPVTSGQAYTVELQEVSGSGGAVAIASPATLTVGSVSPQCNSTSCMTPGTPSVTTLNGLKTVQTSFTNTSNAPVTAIVYAVARNAAGQTVSYSTATITAAAGGSATAYDVLFGLPPGTYTVTIFATSTSGTAISTQSTATVTI